MLSSFHRTVACMATMATMTQAGNYMGDFIEGPTQNVYFTMYLDEDDSSTLIIELSHQDDAIHVELLIGCSDYGNIPDGTDILRASLGNPLSDMYRGGGQETTDASQDYTIVEEQTNTFDGITLEGFKLSRPLDTGDAEDFLIETGVEIEYIFWVRDISGASTDKPGTFIIKDGVLCLDDACDGALAGFIGASALLVAGLAAMTF